MSYNPKAGDIGIMQTKGIVGYMIQFGTRSRTNHVVIADGKGGIYEAKPRQGMCHSPLSDYDGIRIGWSKDYPLTAKQRKTIVTFLDAEVGKRYNFGAILMNIFLIIGLHLPKWVTNSIGNNAGYICSEAAVAAWRQAGETLFPDKEDWFVTPADIEFEMVRW